MHKLAIDKKMETDYFGLESDFSVTLVQLILTQWAAKHLSLSCKVRLESHFCVHDISACRQLICAGAGPALADSLHNSTAEWLKTIGQEKHVPTFNAAGPAGHSLMFLLPGMAIVLSPVP